MRKLETPPAQDLAIDDVVTIEATTVEEAMGRLAAEVGEDARIVSAEKVARGGIGGFFAKEMVVLTARRPEHDRSSLPGVLERMTTDTDLREQAFGEVLRRELEDRHPSAGLGSLLDAAGWSAEFTDGSTVDSHEGVERPSPQPEDTDAGGDVTAPPTTVGPLAARRTFPPQASRDTASIAERRAHEHLVADPPAGLTAPGIVIPGLGAALGTAPMSSNGPDPALPAIGVAPTSTGNTPNGTDSAAPSTAATAEPAWDPTDLVRHGMPGEIVAAVRDLDPADDMGWMTSVAGALEPWCGPLPDGDAVIVGTAADRLAAALGIPLVGFGQVAPYEGTFCSVLTGAPDDRAWLDFVRGNRSLHLVLGDDRLWRDLLVTPPDVVSWVSGTGLVDALYLASTLGATLGFGAIEPGDRLLRARALDVAVELRRIVRRS